jgi:hypothetical protein
MLRHQKFEDNGCRQKMCDSMRHTLSDYQDLVSQQQDLLIQQEAG